MAALDDLKREVERNRDVNSSAVALLNGLQTKLNEAVSTGSMAAVQKFAQQLQQQNQQLAEAVGANTAQDSAQQSQSASSPTSEGQTTQSGSTGSPPVQTEPPASA